MSCRAAPIILAALVAACGHGAPSPDAQKRAEEVADNSTEARIVLSDHDRQRARKIGLLPGDARTLLKKRSMEHGDYAWNEEGVPPGKLTVWVDVSRQTVSVFRAGHEIGTAVILYGAPTHETPLGKFAVLRKAASYTSRSYGAPMPHSLFLTEDGVALHGSDVKPRHATHGCIGLPEPFAEKLFAQINVGNDVLIVRSRALGKAA